MPKQRKKYQSKSINEGVYKSETWLNPKTSPSTSSVVCYDGETVIPGTDKTERRTFIEIGACYDKIRLHRYDGDTPEDFINKLKLLKRDVNKFIMYLEKAFSVNVVKKPRGRKKKES